MLTNLANDWAPPSLYHWLPIFVSINGVAIDPLGSLWARKSTQKDDHFKALTSQPCVWGCLCDLPWCFFLHFRNSLLSLLCLPSGYCNLQVIPFQYWGSSRSNLHCLAAPTCNNEQFWLQWAPTVGPKTSPTNPSKSFGGCASPGSPKPAGSTWQLSGARGIQGRARGICKYRRSTGCTRLILVNLLEWTSIIC